MRILLFCLLLAFPFKGMSHTSGTPAKVYISTHALAKKYHRTNNCPSVSDEKGQLKYVTLSEAKKLGRTACKICTVKKPEVKESGTVYVCTGGSSKKYHSSKDCHWMQSCKGEKISMKVSDAEKAGRTPCKMCFNIK